MNTDTPETDANSERDICGIDSCDASFARKLERQRNKAIDECIALRQMVRELRDALFGLAEECLLSGFNQGWDTYTEAQAALIKAKEVLK